MGQVPTALNLCDIILREAGVGWGPDADWLVECAEACVRILRTDHKDCECNK